VHRKPEFEKLKMDIALSQEMTSVHFEDIMSKVKVIVILCKIFFQSVTLEEMNI
jgi:hypothetical protein